MNTKPETIVFLCPNGHRLNAPKRLEGQPGKCPHCNVRFRVPNPSGQPSHDSIQLAKAASTSSSGVGSLSTSGDFDGSGLADFTDLGGRDEAETSEVLHSSIGLKAASHSPASGESLRMFLEFRELWQNRTAETRFEVHLPEGEVLVPQQFSVEKSTPELGYFARKMESEKYQVHLIPWKAVCRIVISGLSDLPFEP
ncbi:hypothetical protein [Bremerella cremea]|uniref:hypothetical protein n=1 Tax=Bremerella cremea TaxID=1031537 RepID=UPI0031EAA407